MKKVVEKPKSAAVLTIFDAPNMSPSGLRAVAKWLHDRARALIRDGKLYGPRLTTYYLYR